MAVSRTLEKLEKSNAVERGRTQIGHRGSEATGLSEGKRSVRDPANKSFMALLSFRFGIPKSCRLPALPRDTARSRPDPHASDAEPRSRLTPHPKSWLLEPKVHEPFQGSTTSRPQSSKSTTLRVASLAPRTCAMAAICASAWLIGLPSARR